MGWKDMGRGGQGLTVAGVAALVAAVAIWAMQRPGPVGPAAPDANRTAATAPAAPQSPAATAQPAKPAAKPEPVSVAPPSFDVVRAETDGSVLVAGQGAPGARVIVMVDGQEAAPATVDAAGRFVAFLALERSAGPKVLALRMEMPDGMRIESTGDVIVALPAAPVPEAPAAAEVQVAAGDPAPAAAGDAVAVPVSGETPAPADQAATGTQAGESTPPASPPVAAPAVLVADAQGVRVMGPAPEGVVIDTVGYDDQGRMELGGRAGPDAHAVRIYIDGAPFADAPVGEARDWKAPLDGIAPGVHTVRADELDDKGNVTARYEMPVEAADPARIAALAAQGQPAGQGAAARSDAAGTGASAPQGTSVEVVTVQPGQSLWRIAKSRYGDGLRYIGLYDANKGQIKDPDLIYPGQVFALPR